MSAGGNARLDGATIAFIAAGFLAFGAGAYLAATGVRGLGIAAMAAGLVFQVLSLARMKKARNEGSGNARG